MKILRYILSLTVIMTISLKITAQSEQEKGDLLLGVSAQLYPAGFIPTVNLEHFLASNKSLVYRVGVNIIDRQDFSTENDNEEGFGYGGSVGYRLHFPSGKNKFITSLNLDVWNTRINWQDGLTTATPTSGVTNTLVLQPWLEGGYFITLTPKSLLGITAGFGREINVITDGEAVGQGFIGSLSVQYTFKI